MAPHTLSSSVCLFVCFSVTLIFRILQKGTGQSFCPIKLQIFTSKVQGPTGYPFWRLGGWNPPKGLFLPPQNAPANKKSCSLPREIVWNIFHVVKQNFWWKNFAPGTPLSGTIDQQKTLYGRLEIWQARSYWRAVGQRLAVNWRHVPVLWYTLHALNRQRVVHFELYLYGRLEISIGSVPALSRLADCDLCCMTQPTVANKKLSRCW